MIEPKLVLEYTQDLRVLFVEDEAVVAEQTILLLNNYFDRVDHAFDGQEALIKFKDARQASDEYDLIITDINMPNMNGIELCEAVYSINPDQKIIVISAHNEANYLYQLINMGVDRFINKPIEIANITKALYYVCQSISDRKKIKKYYDEIEQLNIALIKKNRELEQSFRMYDKMILKEKLIRSNIMDMQESYEDHLEEKSAEKATLNDFVEHDLTKLRGLHQEMDLLVLTMITKENSEKITEFAHLTQEYSAVLCDHSAFSALCESFKRLSQTLLNKSAPKENRQLDTILTTLEGFLFTLKRWQDCWTSEQKTSANFFDESLRNDIDTIISLWSQEEAF